MARVITAIAFDLKFNVLDTPPGVMVHFTEVAAGGQETHGRATFDAAESTSAWSGPGSLLARVNAVLDARALAVKEPGSVAARITAASDADARLRAAETGRAITQAATEALVARKVALETEIAQLEEQSASAVVAAKSVT